MRYTLTPGQSIRWQQGDPDAWQVEQEVMRWAKVQHITEPVVAVLSNGLNAFAFRLDEDNINATVFTA